MRILPNPSTRIAFWRLFNAPWPDSTDLHAQVREQATRTIHRYWREQFWPFVVGELLIWMIGTARERDFSILYLLPFFIMLLAYLLGFVRRLEFVWLVGLVGLLLLHGMLINGLAPLTAIAMLMPYSFAALTLPGWKRLFVQFGSVAGFWFILLYPLLYAPQLYPKQYLAACYEILVAAFTFQGLRYTSRLGVELNSEYVAQKVTQEVTGRSQQFLARVSHELRTPLNSILGFAKLLRRTTLPEPQSGYLTQIVEEGEQLNHLVSDLLDSAQLSAGKLMLRPGECDINAVCRAVADETHSLLRPGVTLEVKLAPVPVIQADPLRVRQIVRNLVSNAAKYTTAGQITITSVVQEHYVQVAVTDTGPGIPVDQHELVFAPFVKQDHRSGGVGLGLDIARQLARLHGGEIRLWSVPGVGSTFTLILPKVMPNAA
jgi:signal transduction histidine kinase